MSVIVLCIMNTSLFTITIFYFYTVVVASVRVTLVMILVDYDYHTLQYGYCGRLHSLET